MFRWIPVACIALLLCGCARHAATSTVLASLKRFGVRFGRSATEFNAGSTPQTCRHRMSRARSLVEGVAQTARSRLVVIGEEVAAKALAEVNASTLSGYSRRLGCPYTWTDIAQAWPCLDRTAL
jgi:hypothetical protein